MRKLLLPLLAITCIAQSQFLPIYAQGGGTNCDTMLESMQKVTGEEMNVNQTVLLRRAFDRFKSEVADIHANSASYMMSLTHTNNNALWDKIKAGGFGLKADETSVVKRIQTDTGVTLTASQVQDVTMAFKKWKTNINDCLDRFANEASPLSGVSFDATKDIVTKALQINK